MLTLFSNHNMNTVLIGLPVMHYLRRPNCMSGLLIVRRSGTQSSGPFRCLYLNSSSREKTPVGMLAVPSLLSHHKLFANPVKTRADPLAHEVPHLIRFHVAQRYTRWRLDSPTSFSFHGPFSSRNAQACRHFQNIHFAANARRAMTAVLEMAVLAMAALVMVALVMVERQKLPSLRQ